MNTVKRARTWAYEVKNNDPYWSTWSPNQDLQHAPKLDRHESEFIQQVTTSGTWSTSAFSYEGIDLEFQLEGYYFVGTTIEGLDAYQYENCNDFMYVDTKRGVLYDINKNQVGYYKVKGNLKLDVLSRQVQGRNNRINRLYDLV